MKYLLFNAKRILLYCLILAITILIPSGLLNAQGKQSQFKNNELNCNYSLKDGLLNGLYQSYYPNGKKKAEGKFKNNNRIGKWTIWNAKGIKLIEREYVNNFNFRQSFPLNGSNSKTQNKRDSSGMFQYFEIKEKMVMESERIMRIISKDMNALLFNKRLLENSLMNMVFTSQTTAYDAMNSEFTKPLSLKEINEKYDADKQEIIAFKLKEVWFFDTIRKIAETRILGICPIIRSKDDSLQKNDLFWLYYPDIRPLLVKVKLSVPNTEIQNLEDVFYLRYFNGISYRESNIYIAENKGYKKDNEMDDQKIRFQLIESEHDDWMKLLR